MTAEDICHPCELTDCRECEGCECAHCPNCFQHPGHGECLCDTQYDQVRSER